MSTSAAGNDISLQAIDLPIFLTAYDPSDLPGNSVDPLGFERGYLYLADKILPGLTNVADRPRYFSVLCAGAFLAKVDTADPPRTQYQKRLACLLRFERFWALANALATQHHADSELTVSGIRGVTYAWAQAESLRGSRAQRTQANFPLLSRQVPYGAVGIYGAVADGMRFLDRKTLTLTPDLGEQLGEGFLNQTHTSHVLRKAVQEDADVRIGELTEWGQRAHIAGKCLPIERKCLADALHRDPVRSRMAHLLATHPFQDPDDRELDRLARISQALAPQHGNRDLLEAMQAILDYEACYRLVMLGFERLLWLCRHLQSGFIAESDLRSEDVLQLVREQLPGAVQGFCQTLDTAITGAFRQDLHRLEDTRRFLERAAAACSSTAALARELMERHSDVQRGKFDKGRRKMPWLESTAGRISLTMTRVGGLHREAHRPEQITPHPYRLASADSLFAAASDG